jgi:hypothetical protein
LHGRYDYPFLVASCFLSCGYPVFKGRLSTEEVTTEISKILSNISESSFPLEAKKNIQAILRRSSPWSTAKGIGKSYIPNGEPTVAFNNLNSDMESLGMHIVPVGELEGFAKSIPGHGPKWVNSALEKDLKNDLELEEARVFVRGIFSQ